MSSVRLLGQSDRIARVGHLLCHSAHRLGKPLMPNSTVQSYSDPTEYQASILGADVEVILTGPGQFESELTRIEMHQLGLNRGWVSLARIARSVHNKGRCSISFLADADHPPTLVNGEEQQPGQIIFFLPGAEVYQRSTTAFRWGTISFATEDLVTAWHAFVDSELPAPALTRLIRPPPHLLSRLLKLHKAAGDLAATVPDILAHPEVCRAMEQALLQVTIQCIAEGLAIETKPRAHPRQPVMRRIEQVLEQNQDRPIYLPEVCAAAGVSARTLRQHCEEHLGMGPLKYLWLRRMNFARKALTIADPAGASVTTIALDNGFEELGRFSVQYRKLFGESPSVTLRSAPNIGRLARALTH
jgi:AraC-like DNA-binding protein